MYIPKHTAVNEREDIFEIIENNSFAILITHSGKRLNAAHIPILLERNEGEFGTLYGHIAAANDLFSEIDTEALAIFSGPHSYISSSWYETDQSVPTWNYVSAHAYGYVEMLNENEDKLKVVNRLVSFYEPEDSGYSTASLNNDYLKGLIKGITAFRMKITKLEGKKKLSQNHTVERQKLVAAKLSASDDQYTRAIAELMKKNLRDNHDRES